MIILSVMKTNRPNANLFSTNEYAKEKNPIKWEELNWLLEAFLQVIKTFKINSKESINVFNNPKLSLQLWQNKNVYNGCMNRWVDWFQISIIPSQNRYATDADAIYRPIN